MATYIDTIPDNIGLGDVYPVDLGNVLPAAVFGRRALYDELIWDSDSGFAGAWRGKSSVGGDAEAGYTMVLGRQAYSPAQLSLFRLDPVVPGGGGDVVGPASATDNAVVRFDGATGKLVQVSLAIITDAGSITVPSGQTIDGRDVSADGAVLDTLVGRALLAGNGLTGGGDLSADRTFAVGAHADGSIAVGADTVQVGVLATDTQHGVRGGGTQHAAATTSVAGFMSAADKVKLDGLSSDGITLYDNSSTVAYTADSFNVGRGVQVALDGDGVTPIIRANLAAGAGISISGLDQLTITNTARGPSSVSLASNVSTTSTGMSNVTGLSFAVAANTNYKVKFTLAYQTAATTTGIELTLAGPSASVLSYKVQINTATAGANTTTFHYAYGSYQFTTGTDSGGATYYAEVEGVVRPSASGTLNLQFASEVNGSSVTALAGSCGQLWAT